MGAVKPMSGMVPGVLAVAEKVREERLTQLPVLMDLAVVAAVRTGCSLMGGKAVTA